MLLFCLFYFYFEVLAESSKQLLDCAFERSIVTELLPQHGSLSAGVKTYPSPLSLKPDPAGPFTPGTPGHFYLKVSHPTFVSLSPKLACRQGMTVGT